MISLPWDAVEGWLEAIKSQLLCQLSYAPKSMKTIKIAALGLASKSGLVLEKC